MKRNIIVILVLILISSVAISAQDTRVVSSFGTSGNYLIGPGDKITGKVMGESDFNFDVTIDDNGSFELPFVDKMIVAKCRTTKDIKDEVKEHYSRFLKNPMIDVQVTRRPPSPVIVSGEVRAPQKVELAREARLLELLTFTGGAVDSAGGMVKVFRTQLPRCAEENEQKNWQIESDNGQNLPSRMYSLSQISEGTNESNPIINPGDIIVVEKALPVYFVGEVVARQGIYIKEGGLSLTQAVAMVGGTQRSAKTKDVKIYRMKGNNPLDREELSINLDLIKEGKDKDIMLAPYDIIDIEKKKKSMAITVLEIVTGMGRTAAQTFLTSGINSTVLY